MFLLPYSLVCIVSALMLFLYAGKTTCPLRTATLKCLGSLFFLVGTVLVTPWLWRLPFQVAQGGEVIAPFIYAGVPIALLGSMLGVMNGLTAIRTHSTTK